MGLMKTSVDLSKDIDELCPAVLIISLREETREWASSSLSDANPDEEMWEKKSVFNPPWSHPFPGTQIGPGGNEEGP